MSPMVDVQLGVESWYHMLCVSIYPTILNIKCSIHRDLDTHCKDFCEMDNHKPYTIYFDP